MKTLNKFWAKINWVKSNRIKLRDLGRFIPVSNDYDYKDLRSDVADQTAYADAPADN